MLHAVKLCSQLLRICFECLRQRLGNSGELCKHFCPLAAERRLPIFASPLINPPHKLKAGLAVYGAEPGAAPLLLGDLGEQADRATPRVELVAEHRGKARVAAYTVTYGRDAEPAQCTIIADMPNGARCMASSDDAALARRATREELIGTAVGIDGTRFEV